MTSKLWVVVVLIFFNFSFSQTLKGTVKDAVTNQPLETVAVYFDNTTVGTTTSNNGRFSIDFTDAIKSSLVISYLGYEKVIIANYRGAEYLNIALKPSTVALEAVNLNDDDGLTRKQKLKLFRSYFLGTTALGKSCEIRNEEAIYLKYNKQNKTLFASAKSPIIIYNKALGYEVQYDLNDFEIQFKYLDETSLEYTLKLGFYLGTVFFKDLYKVNTKRRITKKREKAFKGSIQHFMRALFNEDLKSQNYAIFKKSFIVNEWDVFKVEPIPNSESKKVTLKNRVSILYDKKDQSDFFLDDELTAFTVDEFGHYSPILGLYFTGYMNQLRVGDMLPLDYGL